MLEQEPVLRGIDAIHAARQHCGRHAVGRQGGVVRLEVDAQRAAGDHRHTGERQVLADRPRHLQSVDGGCPGADHGDRRGELGEWHRTLHPQAGRRASEPVVGDGVVELVEAGGPLGVARDEEADAAPRGLLELADRVDRGEPLRQHLPGLALGRGPRPLQRAFRAELAHERGRRGVTGLHRAAQGHPGEALGLRHLTHRLRDGRS